MCKPEDSQRYSYQVTLLTIFPSIPLIQYPTKIETNNLVDVDYQMYLDN